jgi:histone-lysine N-methyltransferase SETMAR
MFWDCEGLLLCEFLPPKPTISSNKYCRTLEKLCDAIEQKRSGRLTAGVRLLHDGVRPHTSAQTAAWLQKQREFLQHQPHSPDLAPSDFYLFGPFKNFLSGKRFEDQNALQIVLCNTSHPLERNTTMKECLNL